MYMNIKTTLFLCAMAIIAPHSAHAQNKDKPLSYASIFIPKELFLSHDEARDYILNYDQTSVIIHTGREYYVARGPFRTKKEADLALSNLSSTYRRSGICKRFRPTHVPGPPKARSTRFLDLDNNRSGSKYELINDYYRNDPLEIPIYQAVYTGALTYQSKDCPASNVDDGFVELPGDGEMQRRYVDPTSLLKENNWISINVVDEYDFIKTIKDDHGLDQIYYSSESNYIFPCNNNDYKYVIIDEPSYYTGGFKSGALVKSSNNFQILQIKSDYLFNLLHQLCIKKSNITGIENLSIFSDALHKRMIKDEREWDIAQAAEDRRLAAESLNAPRSYYLTCYAGEEYANTIVKTVNCNSPASILHSLQWASNILRLNQSLSLNTCNKAIIDLRYLINKLPQAISSSAGGFLGRCNIGLSQIEGSSRAQESRGKKN